MVIKEEYYDSISLPPIVTMSRIRYEDIKNTKFKTSLEFFNWLAMIGAQTVIDETDDRELKQLLTRLIVQYSE